MRNLFILSAVLIMNASSQAALADEFGDRFYSQTPTGLGEHTVIETESPEVAMDNLAKEVQEISPASGESNTPSDEELSSTDPEE